MRRGPGPALRLLRVVTMTAAALASLRVVGTGEEDRAPAPRLVVEDAAGRPLAGAQVIPLATSPEGRSLVDGTVPPVAQADGAGTVAPWPPPEGEGPWAVVARGHAAEVVARGDDVTGPLLLPAARPLSGRIRLGRGVPAKALEILALPETGDEPGHRTRTSAEGAYLFPHLAPGRWRLALRKPNGRLQTLGVQEGGVEVGETRVWLGTQVTGTLLDATVSGKHAVVAGQVVRLRHLAGGAEGSEEEPQATTDEHGAFRFDGVPPGVYEAWVGTPWIFPDDPPRLEVGFEHAIDGWRLFALRMRSVRTRVLDLEGRPLSDVRVTLLPSPTDPPRNAERNDPDEVSDASGVVVMRPVAPGEGYRLIAAKPGFSPAVTPTFDVSRAADADVPAFRLRPGWRLEVLARDGSGRPLAGVEIVATPVGHPGAADDPTWHAFLRRAVTNADGAAVLEDLADGDLRVVGRADGHLDASDTVQAPRSGDTRVWKPTLYALPGLRGRVEGEGGSAPPPVRIVASPRDGVGRQETQARPDGTFAFEHLRPVATDLEVHGVGGAAGALGGKVPLARVEAVLPGEVQEVVIPLPALRRIQGRVEGLLPGGPSASLVVEAPRYDGELERHRWTTLLVQPLGLGPAPAAFDLVGLPPGTYALRAVQGARDSEALEVRVEGEDRTDLVLDVPPGSRIAGMVLDLRDRPVLGARVRLTRLRGDGDAPELPSGPHVRITGDDGGFVAEDVAPGLWRVEAGDGRATPDVETVRVAEGEFLVVRDLVLGRGGILEGRVEDALGRPLHGAPVTVRSLLDPRDVRRLATDGEGRFRDAAVRPGPYLLRLEGWSGALSRVESLADVLEGQTTTVVLAADGRGTIEGTVRRRGRPVAGVTVELLHDPEEPSAQPRRFWSETDAAGRFGWQALPGGRYEVGLLDQAVRSESTVHLREGDREILDLEVFEGRIVGQVTTLSGDPVGGAEVLAAMPGETASPIQGRTLTAPDGRFVIAGVPIGLYDLRVLAPGLPPAVHRGAESEVQGSEREVRVVLGRGATVDLVVADEGRRGVRGARVWVESPEGEALHPRAWSTGPGGVLRIEGVPPGGARLRVHARGFGRPAPLSLDLADGEIAPVTVTLRPAGALRVVVVGQDRDPVARVRVDLLRSGTQDLVESRRPLTRVVPFPEDEPSPRTGVLLLDDLEEGTYELQVSAGSRYGTLRVPVRVRAREVRDVDLVLGPP